jgi:signal peptidase II
MTRTWRVRAALSLCVAGLVGCDHASKVVAESVLRDRAPFPIVRGFVDLDYTENRDVAFNALSRLSLTVPAWALMACTCAVTALVFAAWMRRQRRSWAEHAGFAFICAGAIGNGLDRLIRGHVVDFIHVHFWPVFNVADVLIVVGVGILALRTGTPSKAALGH